MIERPLAGAQSPLKKAGISEQTYGKRLRKQLPKATTSRSLSSLKRKIFGSGSF